MLSTSHFEVWTLAKQNAPRDLRKQPGSVVSRRGTFHPAFHGQTICSRPPPRHVFFSTGTFQLFAAISIVVRRLVTRAPAHFTANSALISSTYSSRECPFLHPPLHNFSELPCRSCMLRHHTFSSTSYPSISNIILGAIDAPSTFIAETAPRHSCTAVPISTPCPLHRGTAAAVRESEHSFSDVVCMVRTASNDSYRAVLTPPADSSPPTSSFHYSYTNGTHLAVHLILPNIHRLTLNGHPLTHLTSSPHYTASTITEHITGKSTHAQCTPSTV